MATRKPKTIAPEVYPEVDPKLYAVILRLYATWRPDEIGHAIWQYRREHDLIQKREKLKQQLADIAAELEDLE